MRLDRLLGITMELMSKKRVTATELSARFEVSIRTIYRDIELINQSGIPVVSFAGTDGGFELMEGFFLTKQHFSMQDFAVIYNLLKGMEGAFGDQITSLVNKLGSLQPALLSQGEHEKLIFALNASEGEKEIIQALHQAVNERKIIHFLYTNATGESTNRQLEPVHLYWERGYWYLEGYCLSRQAKRLFRVSRMEQVEVTDVMFQPRELVDSPDVEEVRGTVAHLRFDLSAQPRVTEQFRDDCIHLGTHIDVHKEFYLREYAISVILSYGSKVEILSPEDLKIELLEEIKKIQQRYEK
ncbi:helix-turn-helix transcriptional regulator [Paenibacillus arenosi]|uniref:YafY family transcriptional regulator n=1 Tax=Paenibacillus arenosi TaxID=2774142 RepID=A0ABR9B3H1_9BACL|nr:YafY family protein [Paenibacillus arenosi]MBD8500898.1 YafY family transcriptional regulator [Paenibacillus arenosi]